MDSRECTRSTAPPLAPGISRKRSTTSEATPRRRPSPRASVAARATSSVKPVVSDSCAPCSARCWVPRVSVVNAAESPPVLGEREGVSGSVVNASSARRACSGAVSAKTRRSSASDRDSSGPSASARRAPELARHVYETESSAPPRRASLQVRERRASHRVDDAEAQRRERALERRHSLGSPDGCIGIVRERGKEYDCAHGSRELYEPRGTSVGTWTILRADSTRAGK